MELALPPAIPSKYSFIIADGVYFEGMASGILGPEEQKGAKDCQDQVQCRSSLSGKFNQFLALAETVPASDRPSRPVSPATLPASPQSLCANRRRLVSESSAEIGIQRI